MQIRCGCIWKQLSSSMADSQGTNSRKPRAQIQKYPKSLRAPGGGRCTDDAHLDVGVQLHRDVGVAELTDRLGEVDPAAIDLDAGLGLDRLGDVGGGDRPKSLPPSPARAFTSSACGAELGGDGLGGLAVTGLLDLAGAAHRLGLGDDALGGLHREPARHEVVPGVARRRPRGGHPCGRGCRRLRGGRSSQLLPCGLDGLLDVTASIVTPSMPRPSSPAASSSASAPSSRVCSSRGPRSSRGAAVVAVATIATTATLALRDLPHAVGQQRHLTGDADGPGHLTLLLGRVARQRDAAGSWPAPT